MSNKFNDGPQLGMSTTALRSWISWQLDKWEAWSSQQPDASWLLVETGNEKFPTVGHMLVHAFSPVRRYADRIAGREPFDDSAVPADDVRALFNFGRECLAVHAEAANGLTAEQAREPITYTTRSAGDLTSTAEEVFTHALTHCFWHLGGLVQLLRSKGIAPVPASDLIFYTAEQHRRMAGQGS